MLCICCARQFRDRVEGVHRSELAFVSPARSMLCSKPSSIPSAALSRCVLRSPARLESHIKGLLQHATPNMTAKRRPVTRKHHVNLSRLRDQVTMPYCNTPRASASICTFVPWMPWTPGHGPCVAVHIVVSKTDCLKQDMSGLWSTLFTRA